MAVTYPPGPLPKTITSYFTDYLILSVFLLKQRIYEILKEKFQITNSKFQIIFKNDNYSKQKAPNSKVILLDLGA